MRKLFKLVILIVLATFSYFLLTYTTTSLDEYEQTLMSIGNYSGHLTLGRSHRRSLRVRYDYLNRYPFYLDCRHEYNKWYPNRTSWTAGCTYNYSQPARNETHRVRITRAVLVYFPMDKLADFKYELKWLYRSWINVISNEPTKWRTDLIVFTDYENTTNSSRLFFDELNCTVTNQRRSARDRPMCTLFNYQPLRDRNYMTIDLNDDLYRRLLSRVDIFSISGAFNDEFYRFLHKSVRKYAYVDSILMAFEGYAYFKSAGYDFLVRSDMDVFLTPLFARWLPRFCNDFYVGRGGYSTDFNSRRFERIAKNLGFKYGRLKNLGSTWYSTPDQFRLVSYLTLFSMAYLANEEFAQPEREGKLSVLLWPDWHYGVLLLYGQHMALNHLVGAEQLNVVKLSDHLDFPSGNRNSVNKMLHIHVFHGDNLFSKFAFKMGKYDNRTVNESDVHLVKYYALKMALDGKRTANRNLHKMLVNVTSNKI